MGGSWEAAVSGARGACVRVWPVLQAVRRVCVCGGERRRGGLGPAMPAAAGHGGGGGGAGGGELAARAAR